MPDKRSAPVKARAGSPHPAFWKIQSLVHACEAAKAKAQLAAMLARQADALFQQADGELVKAMTAAGLNPKVKYTLEDRDESITPQEDTP